MKGWGMMGYDISQIEPEGTFMIERDMAWAWQERFGEEMEHCLATMNLESETDENENIVAVYWCGGSGTWLSDRLLEIARYVKDGSYLAFVGEDMDIFRWLFKDGKVIFQHPVKIQWPE